MSKKKTILYAFLVMLLWGSLFPMVKLGYSAYGIKTTRDILYFAGVRFVVCGIIICLYSALTDRQSFKAVNKSTLFPIILSGLIAITLHY
ncbi:MAG: EamA family transporter, partial [Clostridia bacterium]|nr:EamA family transporter [Clostridia bacterium]